MGTELVAARLSGTIVPRMDQLPRVPDLAAQRAAMKKLNFLVGEWAGEARIHAQTR
jgi:hypothetical protein